MATQGRNEEGIAQLQEGLAASRATGAELLVPYYLCLQAEAYMETGRPDDGLSALTEALAAADEHENRMYEPEIYCLKGELLLKEHESNATEGAAFAAGVRVSPPPEGLAGSFDNCSIDNWKPC
jgi:predicted ATPase